MKIAINKCYGGFSLSHKAIMRYAELTGIKLYPILESWKTHKCKYYVEGKKVSSLELNYITKPLKVNGTYDDVDFWYESFDDKRTNPALIQVIEELGEEANGRCSELKIIEIPDDVEYRIEEYDGIESVHEVHRIWN